MAMCSSDAGGVVSGFVDALSRACSLKSLGVQKERSRPYPTMFPAATLRRPHAAAAAPAKAPVTDLFRFDGFVLNAGARTLVREGRRLAIGSRAFDVLFALLDRAGQLVTKTELLDRVWP